MVALILAVLLGTANQSNAQCSGMTFTARDYVVCEDNSLLVYLKGAPAKSDLTWYFGNQTIYDDNVDSVRFLALNTGTFNPYVTVKTPTNVTCRVDLPTGKSVQVVGKPKNLSLDVSPGTEICELGGLTKIEVKGGTADMRYTFGVETLNGPSNDNDYRSISASSSFTKRYYVEGYKSVIVEIRNGNGCRTILKDDSLFNVSDLPLPSFSYKTKNDCDKKEVDFTSSASNSKGVSFEWAFESGNPSSSIVPEPKKIVFEGEGKYDVSLTIKNTQGCTRQVTKNDLIIIGEPKVFDIEISDNDVCQNEEVVIRQTGADLSNGSVTWKINGADVAFTNIANTVKRISYPKTGDYDIGITYNMGGCVTEVFYNDTIRVDQVIADFEASAYCNCYPEEITFTNKSKTTDPNDSLVYNWTFKDQHGFVIYRTTEKSPKYQFTQMGEFTIELAVTGKKGCEATKKETIVFSPLKAAFRVSDDKACLGETITASINPSITCLNQIEKIRWTLLDENGLPVDSQFNEQFSYTFNTVGKYALELFIRNKSKCEDVSIKYYAVDVYQLKSQVTTADTFLCANDQVELKMQNGPYNVGSSNSWLIIDSTTNARFTGTGYDLKFKITEPGTFDVLMIAARNSLCADTVLLKNQFKVSGARADIVTHKRESCLPFTDFANAVLINNIQHRDTNYAVSYEWSSDKTNGISFGDKFSDTTDILITKAENYGLNLKVTNNEGCVTYFGKSKAYEAGVVSRWSSNSTACVDVPLTTNNRSYVNANEYKWLITDTNVVVKPNKKAQNPKFIFKQPGKYTIGLEAKNDLGCLDTSYRNINVIDFNFKFFSEESSSFLCAPALVEFTVQQTNVDSFVWMFGDGDTLTTSDTTMGHFYDILDLNPNNEYPFDVKLIGVSKYGCQDTLNIDSFIKLSGPRPNFTTDPNVGTNELKVEFTNLNVGVRYFLIDYGDNSSVDSNVLDTHRYVLNDTTLYSKTYYPKMVGFDDRGCSRTFNGEPITIYNGGNPIFTPDTTKACENILVRFRNYTTLGDSFQWFVSGIDTPVSYDREPEISFATGVHSVTLKVFNDIGDAVSLKKRDLIEVYENPTVEMNVEYEFYCEGREADFLDRSYGNQPIVKRLWDFNYKFNTIDTSSLINPKYIYPNKGSFDVKLWVQDQFGCYSEKVFEKAVTVGDPLPVQHKGISFVSYESNNVVSFNIPIEDTLGTHGFLVTANDKNITPIGQPSGKTLKAGNYNLRVPSYKTQYQLLALNDCRDTVAIGNKHKPVVLNISEKSGTFFPQLNWTKYQGWENVAGYTIVRTTNGENEEEIAYLSNSDTQYVDSLVCDNFYSYYVRSMGPVFNVASKSTRDTISPEYVGPSGITDLITTTVVDNNKVLTTWHPHEHPQVSKYLITRTDPNFGTIDKHAIVEDTFYLDSTDIFASRDIYKYIIKGIDFCQSAADPSIESNTIVLGIGIDTFDTQLEWNLFNEWPIDKTTYTLERATETTDFEAIYSAQNATYFIDEDILDNIDEIFRYRVKAEYEGRIAYSNVVKEYPILRVFIPNAFSPNNDGINDVYKVFGSAGQSGSTDLYSKFKLVIINRWGETVFESNNLDAEWDGSYKGEPCPIGTYVFHVQFQDKSGLFQYYQGNITLLK